MNFIKWLWNWRICKSLSGQAALWKSRWEDEKLKAAALETQNTGLRQQLEDALKQQNLPPQPKLTGEMAYSELNDLLCLKIGPTNKFYIADIIYYLTSVSEMKRFLEYNKTDLRTYVPERWDCDEFSFSLMGYENYWAGDLAFGIAWSLTHAFNIFIDDQKKLWVIEPQTDQMWEYGTKKDMAYEIRMVIM